METGRAPCRQQRPAIRLPENIFDPPNRLVVADFSQVPLGVERSECRKSRFVIIFFGIPDLLAYVVYFGGSPGKLWSQPYKKIQTLLLLEVESCYDGHPVKSGPRPDA
jgi:hypothetical protein